MIAPTAPARPRSWRLWWLAIRPPTLSAAIAPVLVGTATAVSLGHFSLPVALAALAAALLIQIGTNLANDYFDFLKGADTQGRLGPLRVTQSGLLPPRAVRDAAIATFALAALIGVYLVVVGGLPILLIGVFSIAAGVLYTGGPWPFGYHGLGDLFVFVFFGIVAVVGTTYLHMGEFVGDALVNAIPVGFSVTAILVVNNLRDIDTDRAAGKRTLAVRIGRRATRVEFVALLAGTYLVPLLRLLVGASSPLVLLPWLTLPFAVQAVRTVIREDGRGLNVALRGAARLHLCFGILFAVGLLG